jgi:hypothetical protein
LGLILQDSGVTPIGTHCGGGPQLRPRH